MNQQRTIPTTSPRLTRRQFLRRSAALAGAAAVAASVPAFAAGSERKIRVGIVGGRFGASFHFHEHPDCIVEAVSDLRPERLATFEEYTVPEWWKTEMLPPPLRHDSGHHGSHTFITHEFIDSLVKNRKPAVDVYEAIAYTAPGIVAHQSALKGGEMLKIPSFDPSSRA